MNAVALLIIFVVVAKTAPLFGAELDAALLMFVRHLFKPAMPRRRRSETANRRQWAWKKMTPSKVSISRYVGKAARVVRISLLVLSESYFLYLSQRLRYRQLDLLLFKFPRYSRTRLYRHFAGIQKKRRYARTARCRRITTSRLKTTRLFTVGVCFVINNFYA